MTRFAISILTLVFVVACLLAGCTRTPDEQRIRNAIGAMHVAVSERTPKEFLRHVADDFTGDEGALDRAGVANLLRALILRHASIGALIGPIDIEIDGDRAIARFPLTLTGGSGSLLPDSAGQYQFETGWRREGGTWLCLNAQWQRTL